MGSNEQRVFKTLLYSSIFSFPLTEEEIYYYLLTESRISKRQIAISLKKLAPLLSQEKGYITLTSNKKSLKKRIRTEHEVHNKVAVVKKLISFLSWIPSVYFIGISGGVAVGNATSRDDIDLFIITKKGTLFSTRLLLLGMLALMRRRRTRLMKEVSNMVCLNMLIDEDGMRMSQDIYTAHEIAQLHPLFQRKNTYKRFLRANSWMAQFLYHAKDGKAMSFVKKKKHRLERGVLLIEPFVTPLQKILINRHKTTEKVEKHLLAFHPKDYRNEVLHSFSFLLQHHKKTIINNK